MENQPDTIISSSISRGEDSKPKSNKFLIIIFSVIIGVILVALGVMAGFYFSGVRVFSPLIATTTDMVATSSSLSSGNIIWQSPEVVSGIDLLLKTSSENNSNTPSYYKIGKIGSGPYSGGELILVTVFPDGPSIYQSFFRFVKQGDKFVFLKNNSDKIFEDSPLDKTKFAVDDSYIIPELNFPEAISLANGKKLEEDVYVNDFFSDKNLKKVFTDSNVGDVYTSAASLPTRDLFSKNGFYVRAPDGTVRVYSLKPDFAPTGQNPKITWSDGTKNQNNYTYTDKTGCGSSNYASVSTTSESELKVAGKTANGDNVFEFINPSDNALLKDLYNNKYQVYGGVKKVSFQEFVADHPVFFWRDTFGRLIKFENSTYGPTSECGKPVIYLYPTKTERVDVKVEPKGGLSYSDPDYKSGWSVVAKSNGELTEISSGKIYPYLFWEGRGGIYEKPSKGFVVNQLEVHNFLISKLAQLGLNDKEVADFIEFWEPKMQGSPYYFVSFLGNREMDQIAPLTISPKPDTVIRVLMDFSPLAKPIKVEGYNIKTPERRGFTIVEWGGVLR